MYVETIFRGVYNGGERLYRYFIQREDGLELYKLENFIDEKHLEYWKECIDRKFRPIDIKIYRLL